MELQEKMPRRAFFIFCRRQLRLRLRRIHLPFYLRTSIRSCFSRIIMPCCAKTDSQAEQIIIRAYPPFTHYLRMLPLHHSQKELRTTPDYADFAFHLHPTFDFLQELLSQGHEVEVLPPSTCGRKWRYCWRKLRSGMVSIENWKRWKQGQPAVS